MMRFRRFRRKGRRRSPYDMQSVKICDLETDFSNAEDRTCETPLNFGVILLTPNEASGAVTPATRDNLVTSFTVQKGLVFGGLRGEISHFFNPFETAGAECENDTNTTCLVLWEAIYKQSLDANGNPTFLPNLSSAAVGADNDVDILWKRISRLPYWGAGIPVVLPQLAISNQNQKDPIDIRVKRRVSEKEAIMYGFSLTTSFGAGVNCTHSIHHDGWFRIAAKAMR